MTYGLYSEQHASSIKRTSLCETMSGKKQSIYSNQTQSEIIHRRVIFSISSFSGASSRSSMSLLPCVGLIDSYYTSAVVIIGHISSITANPIIFNPAYD